MNVPLIRKPYKLVLLSTFGFLSGCLEDLGVTRFETIPTAIPGTVEFQDRNPGEMVGGTLKITPANDGQADVDKWTFDTYIAQWAVDGVVQPYDMFGPSNFIGRVDRTTNPLELSIYSKPPNGVNSIVISTANALGVATQGAALNFENIEIDPRVPSVLAKPKDLGFSDSSRQVTIAGEVSFKKPATYTKCDETSCVEITDTQQDISEYIARYADSEGCPLEGNPVAKIPKESDGSYSVLLGANGVVVYPPREALSIVVVPANEFGEAYAENCSDYAHTSTSQFNDIWETRYPHFGPETAYLTPDEDSTDSYTGKLVIKPSIDERDLLGGYWVYGGLTTGNAVYEFMEYFDENGGEHTLDLTHWLPTAMSDGSRPSMDNVVFYVSAGNNYTSGNLVKKVYMKDANVVGNWYLINEEHELENQLSEYCIQADAINGEIHKAKCDKHDVTQRFVVENANLSNNDDVHYIKSMAFDNACLYRKDDAGAPNWELRTCDSSWNTQMEIKAYDSHDEDDIMNKKIAVNHGSSWTCLAHYSITDDLSSPWGNCGIITTQIYWKFMKAGRTNDFGLFNDPYVKQ